MSNGVRRKGGAALRSGPTIPPLALVGRDHPALHTPCRVVGKADEAELAVLAPRMAVTCRKRGGMALAANQVGLPYRAIVELDGTCWINPTLRLVGEATELGLEGCLSLPGRWYAVDRHLEVSVVARRLGEIEASSFRTTELHARMWQHEIDHLDGVLISDRWPPATEATCPIPSGAAARIATNAARIAGA